MIVFTLGCDNEHRFEGWFSSNEDYERQALNKLLACPMCGSDKIVRVPHAPYVNTGKGGGAPKAAPTATGQYANLDADMLSSMLKHIIEHTEDVGEAFPEEARRIHYGEALKRHIRGTASGKEVEALKEEGIEVVALPIPPHLSGKTH
jgi:hypothetical protein